MKIKLLLLIFALTLLAVMSITIPAQSFFEPNGTCPEDSVEVSCPYYAGPTCCEWEVAEDPPLEEDPPPEEPAPPEEPLPPVCTLQPEDYIGSCYEEWTEYKCEDNSCGGNRLERLIWQDGTNNCTYVAGGTDADGCTIWNNQCDACVWDPLQYGKPKVNDTAPVFASCKGGGNWSKSEPPFSCDGNCLEEEIPTNPTPINNPQDIIALPTNLIDDEFTNKVSWDDVPSWGKQYAPEYYRIQVNDTDKMVDSSSPSLQSCTFQSNTENVWKVQACCSTDPSTCGPTREWSFNTTLPPELKSPFDPDWGYKGEDGEEYIEKYAQIALNSSSTYPIHLDWCDVPKAKSYYIQSYRGDIKEGEEIPKKEDFKEYCGLVFPFCPIVITPTSKEPINILESEMDFSLDYFTKETFYLWEIATCLEEYGKQCGSNCSENTSLEDECTEFSQRWGFFGTIGLQSPQVIFPTREVVNMQDFLKWKHVPGAKSYRYFIQGEFLNGSQTWEVPINTDFNDISLRSIWEDFGFKLNTEYDWGVMSCWSLPQEKSHCEKENFDDFSSTTKWSFITTGAAPSNLRITPTNTKGKAIVPTTLGWNKVQGAVSYAYEIPGSVTRTITQETRSSKIDFPLLKSGKTYQWRVQTCADEKGEVDKNGEAKFCGPWSNGSFETFTILPPKNPSPKDNEKTTIKKLSWDEALGAKFYQYKVNYISKPPEEVAERCQLDQVIPPKIISSNSDFTSLDCLGEYQWQVKSCVDSNCADGNNWSSSSAWRFTLLQATPPVWGGFVSCGRGADDPNTPYDERESCQIKHLFLMVKSILDFMLWRLGPIILVLLVTATGAMHYFAFASPNMISQARLMLKAAGIGYLILLFGWLMITWILQIFGVSIKWWIIPF